MNLNYDQAIEALRNTPATQEALLNLVKQVSVHAEGAVTVLYSGKIGYIKTTQIVDAMVANGENIRVIDKTPAAEFLKSDAFLAKVAEAYNIRFDHITDPEYRGPAKDWLYHGSYGPWAEASGRFIDTTVGEVRTLSANARNDGVLVQTALSRALANNITHIDNIPLERLQSLGEAGALKAVQAQSAVDSLSIRVAVDVMDGTPRTINNALLVDARDYFAPLLSG